MFIVITRTTQLNWKGWLVLDCVRCGRLRPFRIGQLSESIGLNGLKVNEVGGE